MCKDYKIIRIVLRAKNKKLLSAFIGQIEFLPGGSLSFYSTYFLGLIIVCEGKIYIHKKTFELILSTTIK